MQTHIHTHTHTHTHSHAILVLERTYYVDDLYHVYPHSGLTTFTGYNRSAYMHRHFHVNFGFNTYLFDWLHGTQRRKDRLYGEDIFGGKGRATATSIVAKKAE